MFGQPLVLPGELPPEKEVAPTDFREKLASAIPPATCQPRTYAEAVAGPPNWCLQLAELVYVKRGGYGPPLAPDYSGPYWVIRPGYKYFLIEVRGCQESVSVDRLKPHSGISPVRQWFLCGEAVPRKCLLLPLLLLQPRRSLGLVGVVWRPQMAQQQAGNPPV